jgi:tetratricopeptide (TPR) repeat protein
MPKTDTSTQYFETRLIQDPQSLVFPRLADIHRKNGEFQQAIGVCMEGLKNHPDNVTGRVVLGRCYYEQEKLQEAVAEFMKVVELDRRNNVAVKMIADIYSGQGMKEKAGDLYSFLLRMDPDNKSLVKLTGTFPGQGETSVLKILGIAGGAAGPGAEQDFAGQMPSDIIVDADRTIQMDFTSHRPERRMQDTADFGDMLVKTQQFDVNELDAAAERAGALSVVTSDNQDGSVTGDDVSSRMDTMFGEEETPATAERVEDLGADTSGKHEGGVTGDDISSRMDNLFGEEETPAAVAESAVEPPADTSVKHEGNVTGDDISSRMDTMFGGEETPAAVVESAGELPAAASVKHEGNVTGDDINSRLDTLFGEGGTPAAAAEPEVLEHIDIGTEHAMDHTETSAQTRTDAKDDWVVSGSDISSRLEQLFGEEQKPEEAEKAEPEADFTQIVDMKEITGETKLPASKTSLFTAPTKELRRDELRLVESSDISGEDITSRLNDMFDEAPAVETEEAPVFDVAAGSPAASLTDATEEITLPGAGKPPAAPVDGTGFSGDDVKLRHETIFDEGEASAEPDVAGTDVIPAEELEKPRPEEETKRPVSGGEPAVVIGDEDEGIEETIIAPAAKLPVEKAVSEDKTPAAPAIDDMEEEDASPGMSGDDVAGRLEEYFGDSNSNDVDLKPAAAVESDDTMLSDIDESEETMVSDHGKAATSMHEEETLNMARGPEEKTVLMDEDGGEDTMPAKKETIISGASDPFLPNPPRARAKIDERDQDETVRAAAPPRRRDDIFSGKPSEKPRDEDPDAEQTQAYSIPDHVLTPTLADIYFQQGQPQLALQIYRRLLSADPDNERMAQRIAEIERGIATQEVEETVAMEHARKITGAPEGPAAPLLEKKPKKSGKSRPLAGVRIKRKFKAKRKKLK